MKELRPNAFSDALVEQALSREPDRAVAAQTFERILAGIADRPQRRPGLRQVVASTVTSRPRVALGWVALVVLLIGILLAVAVLAGGPKTRPVLGVLPTTATTTQPTAIARATDELRPTLPADCLTLSPDAIRATSPGGSLTEAAPRPVGSPSNGLIAYATRSAILTYDPATGARREVATLHPPTALGLGQLTWSPDGRRLVFAGGTDLFWCDLMVANADGSGVAVLARLGLDRRDNLETIAWSPDGRSLVYNDGHDADLVVLTIDDSSRPLEGTHNCWWPAWSPDGSRIACIGAIVTVASGASVTLPLNSNGDPGSPVWAADSQSITALGQPGQDGFSAYSFGVDGGVRSSIDLPGSSAWTPGVLLSPDGSRVLARVCPVPCVNDVEYQVVPIDGSPAISLGRGLGAVWSDDGSRVAIATAEGIVIGDAKDGARQLAVQVASVHGVSWSPDQTRLLYSLESGQLWTVPVAGGETTLIDEGAVSTASGAAWQPVWP